MCQHNIFMISPFCERGIADQQPKPLFGCQIHERKREGIAFSLLLSIHFN